MFFCLVSLILCFTACQSGTPDASPAQETAVPEDTAASPSPLPVSCPLEMVDAETDEGAYAVGWYGDGSWDILYYEYASASCSHLSCDLAPEHDPDDTVCLPDANGNMACVVSGQNLYLLRTGFPYSQKEDRSAFCDRMDLKGTNGTREELGDNLVIDLSLPMVGDAEGNLYFTGNLVDPETVTTQTALLKVGPGISGYEVLAQWEGEEVVLAGAYGAGFVLDDRSLEESGLVHRFFTLDPETGAETPFSMDTTSIASYTIQEGILYYTLSQDGTIYRYDIRQGAALPQLTVTLPQGNQPSWARITGKVRDNHLLLSLGDLEGEDRLAGGLDLETGAFSPVTLGFEAENDWRTAPSVVKGSLHL